MRFIEFMREKMTIFVRFMRERAPLLLALDRAAVLLLGVLVGSAIGFAFHGGTVAVPAIASAPAPVVKMPAAPTPATAEASFAERCAPSYQLQRQLQDTASGGGRVRIGVFGDSFGKGVWSGLLNQLPGKAGYEVTDYGQEAIGFTRY